jgi:hypothetical protein
MVVMVLYTKDVYGRSELLSTASPEIPLFESEVMIRWSEMSGMKGKSRGLQSSDNFELSFKNDTSQVCSKQSIGCIRIILLLLRYEH